MQRATQFRIFGQALTVLFVLSMGIDCARAQFLDKLEAEIRSRLEAAQQPPSTPGSSVSSDELPAPPVNPQPNVSGTASPQLPSILEAPIVPQPYPAGNDSSPRSGGVYLGLEAEEAVGGGLGVRVSNITKDSPAWKAGFEVGDRIQAINGIAISDLKAMASQLTIAKPRETLRFLVARGGRNLELTAVPIDADLAARTLGLAAQNVPMPSQFDLPATEALSQANGPAWLGLTANDLTTSFRQQFGISVFRGAAVTNVDAGSPAAVAGIRAGDAITEIGGQPIEKADALLAWVERAKPGDVAELMVARGVFVRPITITFTEQPTERKPLRFSGRAPLPGPTVPAPTLALTPPAANMPAEVEPAKIAPASTGPTPREQELERELTLVRKQLRLANEKLAETQKKLDEIANALRRN